MCALQEALASSLQRSDQKPTDDVSLGSLLSTDDCRAVVDDWLVTSVLDSALLSDNSAALVLDCVDVKYETVQEQLRSCRASATLSVTNAHRRNMLQVGNNVIPGEVNQTATDVRNAIDTASNAVNNATSGLQQLGENSSLDQAAQAGNASVGQYVNAFVNDTTKFVDVVRKAVTGSAGESAVSKSGVLFAVGAAVMLALPML